MNSEELSIPKCELDDCDELPAPGKPYCSLHSSDTVAEPQIQETKPVQNKCKVLTCEDPVLADKKYCAEHQAIWERRKAAQKDEERIIRLRENDFLVREARLNAEAQKVKQNTEYEALVNAFEPMAEANVASILAGIDVKAEAIKHRLPFIGAADGGFTKRVPFYRGNLILIGAMTGHGKTTVMAAIAYRLIIEGHLPLIMTNETSIQEFFVALACLSLGSNYRKFSQFTDEQVANVKAEIQRLAPLVRVVDQLSVPGGTTSVNGLKVVLNKVTQSEKKPACVLLDYLQGISEGVGAGDQSFEVQHDATEVLWSFILRAGIPIVAFSQLHPKDKQRATLEDRIKLGKHILTRVTFALEYIPQYKDGKTGEIIEDPRALWRPWKNREMASAEEMDIFYTPFNYGHFGEPERLEDIMMKQMEAAEEQERKSGQTSH